MTPDHELDITYPDMVVAYISRYREQSRIAYRSDREAWTIIALALDDLKMILRSLQGRAMIDARPLRDCLVRIGAESQRAAEDLTHDMGLFFTMATPEYHLSKNDIPQTLSVLHLFSLMNWVFDQLNPAISRLERSLSCQSASPRASIHLMELDEIWPIDVYVAMYCYAWIGAERLRLVKQFEFPTNHQEST